MAETTDGQRRLRLVFMGTPDFAAEILKAIHGWPGGEIVGVYTQPDRPCGRGQACLPSAVKRLALELGLPVFQPENFKAQDDRDALAALEPDILLVAAYGLILPQSVLDIPPHGAINVHASLLPKYRGAAPIQRAIMAGDPATGITIMRMEAGLDTGPMLLQRAVLIGYEDTAETIHDQLAAMGGRLLIEALTRLVEHRLFPIPQDDARATYASKLRKEESAIDFDRPAAEVHNIIRALHPWPGATLIWSDPALGEGKPLRLSLYPGKVGDVLDGQPKPGTLLGLVAGGFLAIACRDRAYLVPTVKPEGRKAQTAEAFACGYLSRCVE